MAKKNNTTQEEPLEKKLWKSLMRAYLEDYERIEQRLLKIL